jgi:hypothetical protein
MKIMLTLKKPWLSNVTALPMSLLFCYEPDRGMAKNDRCFGPPADPVQLT